LEVSSFIATDSPQSHHSATHQRDALDFVDAFEYLCGLKNNKIAMSEDRINVESAPKPVGSYPHARRVGNLLFLSGVGPRAARSAGSGEEISVIPGLELDKNGNFLEFDFEAQCRSVFNNVRTILDASGSSWENLVDVTVFLVDMKRDFKIYNRVYAEYFKDNQPCRTTVEVNCLPTPIAIELKCIATTD
jgi:2-aminomuconate deaminase